MQTESALSMPDQQRHGADGNCGHILQTTGPFKKCLGRKQSKDGVVRPAIFWLGPDRRAAQEAAERIAQDVMRQPWALEGGVWTQRGLDAAQQEVFIARHCRTDLLQFASELLAQAESTGIESTGKRVAASVATPAKSAPTLYQAIDAFSEAVNGKKWSEAHRV